MVSMKYFRRKHTQVYKQAINTANYNESGLFHKRLRTAWQNHQSVT
jgi:hypothetical protein